LFAQTQGAGNAGDLRITTGRLIAQEGGQVSAATFGEGQAGNLTVTALQSIELIGRSADDQASGLFTQTEGAGDAGELRVTTGQLIVQKGAEISAATFNDGDAGNIFLQASDLVEVSGAGENSRGEFVGSIIGAPVDPRATGAGGDLTIETRELRVLDGAQISAATAGEKPGGNIIIDTERLTLQDGGQILALTVGQGRGGTLTVKASEFVELTGTTADGVPSGLFTQSQGKLTQSDAGDAGDLSLSTRRLIVRDGAAVSSDTFADGQGGSLTVNASDSIEVIGTSAIILSPGSNPVAGDDGRLPSRLTALTTGSGDAGNVIIETRRLTVRDGARVAVEESRGTGAAGNLVVQAPEIRLDNRGVLTAETRAGRGNITLRSQHIQLRHGSNITTDARGPATGGNITIDTDTLVALENSDISANAEESFGGRVLVNAQGIFGTKFREQVTAESDITATSALGPEFNGIVEINTPDIDPTRGLMEQEEVSEQKEIAQCEADRGSDSSSLINKGRGGLPTNPSEVLGSTAIGDDVGSLNQTNGEARLSSTSAIPPAGSTSEPIVEAQGWVWKGRSRDTVMLTSKPPSVIPISPLQAPNECNGN
jgi:large exoprotein involved in heme utilization and adhesion